MIDAALARRLVASQFPQWKDLAIHPVRRGGVDNRTFHLGAHMLIRMPSAEAYAAQAEKEQRWLPKLAPSLPLPIPQSLAFGEPGEGYAWKWSVYRWIDGESAASGAVADPCEFALKLAQFLTALQRIDATNGPKPGPHNFHRGGSLATYDEDTRHAIAALSGTIDTDAARAVWDAALATQWQHPPVWVHGDVSAGNLVVNEGHLSAVIDFGMLGIGDPACDLAIAWTLFNGKSRDVFRTTLLLDPGTWARGRGWTLWKALILAAGTTNTDSAVHAHRIIDDVLTG